MFEFFSSTISIADTIYGTILYFITGFHGFHVFFGLVCLSFILLKAIKEKKYLTRDRFVSFNSFILY
jgi:heme/copper-type cytochrome/quinol oxidase subunit 3